MSLALLRFRKLANYVNAGTCGPLSVQEWAQFLGEIEKVCADLWRLKETRARKDRHLRSQPPELLAAKIEIELLRAEVDKLRSAPPPVRTDPPAIIDEDFRTLTSELEALKDQLRRAA